MSPQPYTWLRGGGSDETPAPTGRKGPLSGMIQHIVRLQIIITDVQHKQEKKTSFPSPVLASI